jgi:hypothetical protein
VPAKVVLTTLSCSDDQTWDRLDALRRAVRDNRVRAYKHSDKDVKGSSWGGYSDRGS